MLLAISTYPKMGTGTSKTRSQSPFWDGRLGALEIAMPAFAAWFPPLIVGVTMTIFGTLKLYGLYRGIVGGRDKTVMQRACGT